MQTAANATDPLLYNTLDTMWRPPVHRAADRTISARSRGSARAALVVRMKGDGYRPRVVRCEGGLEFKTLLVLVADPRVVNVWEQVGVAFRDDAGALRHHFFDFLLQHEDGRKIAIAVRPEQRARRLEHTLRAVAAQWGDFADGYTIVHTVPRDRAHNAALIHAVRRDEDRSVDDVVRGIAATLHGRIRIEDLVAISERGAQAFRAIARLIGEGELELAGSPRICYRAFVAAPLASLAEAA